VRQEAFHYHSEFEIASEKPGAVLRVEECFSTKTKQKTEKIADKQYRIPLYFGIDVKLLTIKILPLFIQLPSWLEDEKNPKFQRLRYFATTLLTEKSSQTAKASKSEDVDFDLKASQESCIELLERFLSPSANKLFKQELLTLVINIPHDLSQALSNNAEPPEEDTDDFSIIHPSSGENLTVEGESIISTSRQAWLLLALIQDDENSGPEQFLRYIHNEQSRSSQEKKPGFFSRRASAPPQDTFLDNLVEKTIHQSREHVEAATQAENIDKTTEPAINKKIENAEILAKIGGAVAPSVIDCAKIATYHRKHPSNESREKLEAASSVMKKTRQVLGQQRFKVPKDKKQLTTREEITSSLKTEIPEDTRRFKNEEMSRGVKQHLEALRLTQALLPDLSVNNQLPEDYIYALLQFQRGNFSSTEIPKLLELAKQSLLKDAAELTHDEVATLFSMEMEIVTRPRTAQTIFNKVEESVLGKTAELHERGLYFVNSKLSNVHDPLMLHMSGGDFCLIHTPGQLQMLSNLTTQIQGIATGLPLPVSGIPSFSVVGEIFSSIPSMSQGIPLFAQGFAALGVGLAGMAFVSGKRTESRPRPLKKTLAKGLPPASVPESLVSKPLVPAKSGVIFQASSGGGHRESRQAVPSRPPSARETARKIVKEPTATFREPIVKKIPEVVFQPSIIRASSSEKKTPKDSRNTALVERIPAPKKSQIPTAKVRLLGTSETFAKRLEQVFEAKNRQTTSAPSVEARKIVSARTKFKVKTEFHRTQIKQKSRKAIASPLKISTGIMRTAAMPMHTETRASNPKTKAYSKTADSKTVEKRTSREETVQHIKAQSERKITRPAVTNAIPQEKKVIANKELQPPKKKIVDTQHLKRTGSSSAARDVVSTFAAMTVGGVIETAKRVKSVQTRVRPATSESSTPSVPRHHQEETATSEEKVVANIAATQPLTPVEVPAKHIKAKRAVVAKEKTPQLEKKNLQQATQSMPEETKATAQNTRQNLVTLAAALVGGVLSETAKRVSPLTAPDRVPLSSSINKNVGAHSNENTKTDAVDALRARKHTEYSQGRGGGGATQKKKTATPVLLGTTAATQQTDRVVTATMRSLPTNAMIDVSDSFNTAREVSMWAREALAYPPR